PADRRDQHHARLDQQPPAEVGQARLPPLEVRPAHYFGIIQPSTAVPCNVTRTHMNSSRTTLQNSTLRKISPSRPAMPTAPAAIARFCGLILLSITPPEELAAASSTGSRCARAAVCTCRAPNSALDDVSDPVTATSIQPRIDDRNTNSPPAAAKNAPSVFVCPDWLSTYASASTAITVTIAYRSST